jgi:TonB family protein
MALSVNDSSEKYPRNYAMIKVMFRASRLLDSLSSTSAPSLLCLILLTSISIEMHASQNIVSTNGQAIVSVSHPRDSRGEVVYETQGVAQKDHPIVVGTFAQPTPIKLPQPKYPKLHKKQLDSADITVEGIISENGEFIDARVVESADQDFSQSALDAVARYKFKPATLGKPVAVLARIVVNFRIK